MTVEASELYRDPRPRCPYMPGLRCGSKFEPIRNEKNGRYTCRDPVCASMFRFPALEGQDGCGSCGKAARCRKTAKIASTGGAAATAVSVLEVRS